MKENNKRLKIAFFTPLKEGTKSFYFSKNILPFLKEYCDIDIFSDETIVETFCSLNVYHYKASFLHNKEKKYDIFFYQVEDSIDTNFCRLHLSLTKGVVFFHDYYVFTYPPQAIISSLVKEQCDNIKRDLGKALFSLTPSPFIIHKAKAYTRNNISSIYKNNITYLPYPLEDFNFKDNLNEKIIEKTNEKTNEKIKEQNKTIKILFEGSTSKDSRYFKMLRGVKNIKDSKLTWLTSKEEIEVAKKLCIDNGIKQFEVLENNFKNMKEAILKVDVAICLVKFLNHHNIFLILNALKNGVFVIANKLQNSYTFIDDLEIFPKNYIAKVSIGKTEEKEIEFFINAYKDGKVMLDYKKLYEEYLINFSSKYVAKDLYNLLLSISDDIKEFYKAFEKLELEARNKVLKKAFLKDDEYLKDAREELGLV
ncbi:MAG: hypothetical protein ACOX3T_01505 [Bdellovibrionota bacterium]